MFEGEDHRKAALETRDQAFHLRQRVKANWRALLQDQHRMRLANMRSGPLSLLDLVSQRQRCTSHPAHDGQRPRIFSTPGDPAHLLRTKQGTRNKETPKTASRHSTSTPSCRAAAFSPVRGRANRSASANAAEQLVQARLEAGLKACALMDPFDQVQDCVRRRIGFARPHSIDRRESGVATSQD